MSAGFRYVCVINFSLDVVHVSTKQQGVVPLLKAVFYQKWYCFLCVH